MSARRPSISRRDFIKTAAAAAAVASTEPLLKAANQLTAPKLKLGMDNFSIRGLGWKAPRLIEYAASEKLDLLFMSDLDVYESFDEAYLRDLKAKADSLGLALHVGSWSVCPSSKVFRGKWGTADEHLALGIKVAQTLGSPIFRCVLGTLDDRRTEGGIRARMGDMLPILKGNRSRALDAGVKISVENHAGDMNSFELLELLDQVGYDAVGVTFDSGNAAWTLEDPFDALERLGPHTLTSGLRDDVVWQTAEGVNVQWTAAGEGLINWQRFAERWASICPGAPFVLEIISGFSKPFATKTEDFWNYYEKRPESLAKFDAFSQGGRWIHSTRQPGRIQKPRNKSISSLNWSVPFVTVRTFCNSG